MEINCPCGNGNRYETCCGPYIEGKVFPPTPEALMRSRYTAYTRANIDYIIKTMKPPASDGFNAVEAKAWARGVKWKKLEVIHTQYDEHKGTVEFIAYYNRHKLHEVSQFRCDDGVWFYVDGN